mgnify:CR=1 FL=1
MYKSELLEGLEVKDTISTEGITGYASLIGDGCEIPLSESVLSKHVLYTGTIGTGKTTAMFQLLRQLIDKMNEDDVMIVFDTKGDFAKEFYRPGKDVIISSDDKATAYWNIFKEVLINGEEHTEENLLEIVNSLFGDKIQKSNAPFFPQAAKEVLYGIMYYIIAQNEREDIHNAELYAYLRDASINDVVDAFMSMGDLRGIIDYIYNDGDASEQTQGVYSELRNVTNELFVGNFRRKGDFSVREFVREKKGRILFIEYDLSIGKVLTPIYKALFDLAIKESLSRSKSEGNVFFIIDEFKLLPNLYHIDNGVNFGRSLGAKFVVAMQNVQQIIEAYGKEKAYSILSAFGTSIAFRVTDKASIEFVQNLYGKSRKRISYKGLSYSAGTKEEVVYSEVVGDWDILGLKTGEAIISVADYDAAPIKFKFKK